jgi:hypothetical protein
MQPRNPAVREGLMFGGGLGILFVLNFLLSTLTGFGLLSIVLYLVALATYLVVGMRAGQATGRVQSGLVAGLVTGLFSSLINAVVVVALSFVFVDTLVKNAQAAANALGAGSTVHYTSGLIITGQIVGVLLGTIFGTGIGLGLGALGGNIGKGRAPLPQQAYQESLYQGMPVPQQPGQYPPPPPYPPAAYPPAQQSPGQWQPPQQQ